MASNKSSKAIKVRSNKKKISSSMMLMKNSIYLKKDVITQMIRVREEIVLEGKIKIEGHIE